MNGIGKSTILNRSVNSLTALEGGAVSYTHLDDTSRDNLMRQSIDLISKFPTIIAYAYNMLRHATYGRSLHIRHPVSYTHLDVYKRQ